MSCALVRVGIRTGLDNRRIRNTGVLNESRRQRPAPNDIKNKKRDAARDQEQVGTFVFLFRIAPEYSHASPFRWCRTLQSSCMHRHQAGGTDVLSLLADLPSIDLQPGAPLEIVPL